VRPSHAWFLLIFTILIDLKLWCLVCIGTAVRPSHACFLMI
jgi:hypothetical protein